MIGLFFISAAVLAIGIVLAIALWHPIEDGGYNMPHLSLAVLLVSITLAIFGWTLCWAYDSFNELTVRMAHSKMRIVDLPESDLAKFNIDLSVIKPVYIQTYWRCPQHQSAIGGCDNHCKKDMKYYHLVLVDDDCEKISKYDELTKSKN